MCVKERLLNHVGGADLAFQLIVKLRSSQHRQIIAVPLQQLAQLLLLAALGLKQQ